MITKRCQCCGATYERYRIGTDSEFFGCLFENIDESKKPSGLCTSCNKKSSLYMEDKECHNQKAERKA